jgi:hypothetical protein
LLGVAHHGDCVAGRLCADLGDYAESRAPDRRVAPRWSGREFLRYLHDHPRTRFALILVGGDGCWEVLSREPMLRSRIFRRVNVTPLTGAQVCELMGTFHPIYTGVDKEVLSLVDDHFAHGNLRD